MASKNLEQGILSVQQQDLAQGKRLLKIALKNDPLNQQERIQALIWLAETESDPQLKVQQYQQAIQIDPTNQDVINRLSYWNQLAQQQGGTAPQGMPPANPNQATFNNQGLTPSQGIPPVDPNQQQNWQGQNQQFNQAPFNNPGLTPSQGMPPVNPNQQSNQPAFNNPGLSSSQEMPRVNPNQQQNWQQQQWQEQNQQPFNPGIASSQSSQLFGSRQTDNWQQQPPPYQLVYGQQPAIQLSDVQRTVGITGGPNGAGTGFFATRSGLIATTRHVVGGERQVTVQLLDRRQMLGDVVRSFPEFDLALIQVNVQLVHLLGVSQAPVIPDDTPIVAVTHAGEGIRSAKRHSINEIEQFWFPTIINYLKDAGGNPIFDPKNMLVGMLTSNASRSNGYMYGLHIHAVYHCIDQYIHEKGQLEGQNTLYCAACGIISRAPSFGGYFCENCGNTHPYAVNTKRHPQLNLGHLYGEDSRRPCPNCASQVGFHGRECLRCGYEL